MKVKICGLQSMEDVKAVNNYLPEAVGFVFAKSKRQINVHQAQSLSGALNKNIDKTGVFVDAPIEQIIEIYRMHIIDTVQLHGAENRETIEELRELGVKRIIKAVSMKEDTDLKIYKDYPVDYLLLDQGKGGTGISFDWKKIKDCPKPFYLAGGISISNLKQALQTSAYALDISSGVETNGKKDEVKIKEVMEVIRNFQ